MSGSKQRVAVLVDGMNRQRDHAPAIRPGNRGCAGRGRPRGPPGVRRPGPGRGAAPGSVRCGLRGHPRPLRRRRLPAGPAGDAGDRLHRVGGVRVGAGDEPGQVQGRAAAAQPAHRPGLRHPGRTASEVGARPPRQLRLPGGGVRRRRGHRPAASRWPTTSWSWRRRSRRRSAAATRCWSSGWWTAGWSRWRCWTARRWAPWTWARWSRCWTARGPGAATAASRAERARRSALQARFAAARYRSLLRIAQQTCEALGVEGAALVELTVSDRLNEVVRAVDAAPVARPRPRPSPASPPTPVWASTT